MQGETSQRFVCYGGMDGATETLGHNNEKERGQRVALSDSSGRRERLGGDSINQDRKEGRGGKI
jgi:hypothetical protein